MATLDFDTEDLKSAVRSLRSANNRIIDAASILNSITEHYDWKCKERDQINRFISDNRTKGQNLQERIGNFLQVADAAADDMVQEEGGISKLFSSVENALSRVLSIVTDCVGAKSVDVGQVIQTITSKLPWKSKTTISTQWDKAREILRIGRMKEIFEKISTKSDTVSNNKMILPAIDEGIHVTKLSDLLI